MMIIRHARLGLFFSVTAGLTSLAQATPPVSLASGSPGSLASSSPVSLASGSLAVHGHRGARARFPENTLPAFRHALEVGADYLEMDLNVTRDNVLIVNHDPDLSPLCRWTATGAAPATRRIRQLSAVQVKGFDCGAANPKFPRQVAVPGTRLSTFDELLSWLAASELPQAKLVQLNVETKVDPDSPEPDAFVALILRALRDHAMLDRTVLQSFDYRTLASARRTEPRLRLSALTQSFWRNSEGIARTTHANFISPYLGLVHAGTVDRLHQRGVGVLPWTANTRQQWGVLIAKGVDGIITDDPAGLIEYLRERGLRP